MWVPEAASGRFGAGWKIWRTAIDAARGSHKSLRLGRSHSVPGKAPRPRRGAVPGLPRSLSPIVNRFFVRSMLLGSCHRGLAERVEYSSRLMMLPFPL